MPEFSSETWTYIIIAGVALFALGVFARVRNLMKISEEIESKLDYSKMKKWEDDDDDWGSTEGSLVDKQRASGDDVNKPDQ